jgi:integrase
MRQLSFLEDGRRPVRATAARGPLDPQSEALLGAFRARRLAEGVHPRSVAREVSQLRAMAREGGASNEPGPLPTLMADVGLLARVLRQPRTTVARSTGRARLLAVQRCIRLMSPQLGRDPVADLAALDALLPARRSIGWHAAGTLVAGIPGRRRRPGPTLDGAHLRAIVEAAGTLSGERAARDRALLALHCFSGLRAEEILGLRWEDLTTELAADGYYGLAAAVERSGRHLRLPLPGPAAEAVEALAEAIYGRVESLSGPLIRAHRGSARALGYRAARGVLRDACRKAGLPPVESVQLRAACAHWLRSQGLSDHEVATVMGLARVRSVDRLLRRHAALDAHRSVRELFSW